MATKKKGTAGKKRGGDDLTALDPFDGTDGIRILIETPKGSRNKYKYDQEMCAFILSGVLPAGAAFPFDFGLIPATLGEDGDPLDILVLMDEPAFAGCLVDIRPIGVIEAEQSDPDGTRRNDRLISVAGKSRNTRDVHSLDDLNGNLLDEIEYFFVSYNRAKGRTFQPLARRGPARALELIEEGRKRLAADRKRSRRSGSKR